MITDHEAIAALARVDALHTALSQIVLEGGDLDRIAEEVAGVLGLGVLVTSTDGRERAATLSDDARERLVEHGLLLSSGRVRTERMDQGGVRVGAGEARSLRVAAAGVDLARLIAVRTAGRITENDVHALERAATVAALLITRQEAVTAVENKYQGDFLRELFLRGVHDETYVAEHAEAFGWRMDRPVVVTVAEIDPPLTEEGPVPQEDKRRWQERFSAAWRLVSSGIDPHVPSVDFSSEVVTLLPVGTTGEAVPGEAVVRRAVTAVAGDKGGGRRAFTVGVSRVATTPHDLPEAYAQARRAVVVGRRVGGRGSTTFFDQLGLHRLLALVPDQGELRDFSRDVLGPLCQDTTEAVDLRTTLQVLLDTNFNVAEAARAQFFHYNTMRYRVSKLERMLGPLSTDPHLRLDVAVALRALEIAD